MRTDVKLGIGLSTAVVALVGGYFSFRDTGGKSVPVATSVNPTTPPVGKAPSNPNPNPTDARRNSAGKATSGNAVNPNDRKAAAKPESLPNSRQSTKPNVAPGEVKTDEADKQPPVTNPTNPRPEQVPAATSKLAETQKAATPTPGPNVPSVPAQDGVQGIRRDLGSPYASNYDLGPQPNLSRAPENQPVARKEGATESSLAPAQSSPPQGVLPNSRTVNAPNVHGQTAASTDTRSPGSRPGASGAAPVKPQTNNPNSVQLASDNQPLKPLDSVQKNATTSDRSNIETHKVQPGESLASVAQNYYGSEKFAKFLMSSNPHVRDPNRLAIGTVLKIPPAPENVSNPAEPAAGASGDASKSATRAYRVQAGDTFYSIAKSVLGDANRWKELFNLNKSAVNGDATQLQIGQVLKLPEK